MEVSEELLSEKRQLSEELTTIIEEYGNVVGRVEAAGKETHLEKALTEEQSCLETLEGVRDKDASELIGNVLVAHMRRQQHQGQQEQDQEHLLEGLHLVHHLNHQNFQVPSLLHFLLWNLY